jgi:hypothetical protein
VSIESAAASSRLPSLRLSDRRWQKWLSAAISFALLGAIASQLHKFGFVRLGRGIPTAPAFWLALSAYYLALPSSEWIIYRRLWDVPASGFAALLRKLVSNEVLLGYSGEVAFYGWARARLKLTSTPFGAIKDVSILSAFSGNIATLAMMVAAWPFLRRLHLPVSDGELLGSLAAILAISIAIGLMKRRIFSLPADDLHFIFLVHMSRLTTTTFLSMLIWRSAMPGVSMSAWVLLAALQLLVTRLPFVPNKDLVFAATTMLLVGGDSRIGAMIALVAGLVLAAHLVIGAALAARDLIETAEAA